MNHKTVDELTGLTIVQPILTPAQVILIIQSLEDQNEFDRNAMKDQVGIERASFEEMVEEREELIQLLK